MSSFSILSSLFAATVFVASTSSAQLLIIGGTDPDYLNNGSFETETNWWIGELDNATTLSSNLGVNQGFLQRDNITPPDGDWYAVVGANLDREDLRGFYQDTGYDLVEGDTFNLSFWHAEHYALESGDSFSWMLFTTSTNTDQGVVDSIIASGDVDVVLDNEFVKVAANGIGEVTSDLEGARLFIAFLPTGLNNDYVALDEVNLSLVPEPGVYALMMGVVVLGGLFWRRRYYSR
ncbi:PEP-CTERM sorting domain-containing protein [Cerasicoccus frondis]|uniref:PEP-CTERM sorting domain-containing protein n=1 Tax=Cerasicoccus frondis TaxID=490090 RepID=UPI0028527529|nr:PEP-CTERM sorting domain-containing protein [Cerasicoccus frondis]